MEDGYWSTSRGSGTWRYFGVSHPLSRITIGDMVA